MRGLALVVLLGTTVGCYRSHDRSRDDHGGTPSGPDMDSDGDCLSDRDEIDLFGTDPHDRDTDGDGLTDWVEVAAGTDPLDPVNGTRTSQLVLLPYMGGGETRDAVLRTRLEVADVYFLIDTTGSMSPAIENVATSLRDVIVPGLRDTIADVQMGVGHFNDVPYGHYGSSADEPFWHVQDITPDDTAVQAALDLLYTTGWGMGSDGPEANAIALWCTATGSAFGDCGSSVAGRSCPDRPGEVLPRLGYPCFRPESLPIVVHVSDAPWHNCEDGSYAYDCTDIDFHAARDALVAIGARHVGVFVGSEGMGLDSMRRMSLDTGAVDSLGAPLVETASSGEVSGSIVSMIATLASALPTDVTAEVMDVAGDPVGAEFDATRFVTSIRAVSGDPPPPLGYSSMDGMSFHDVVPGTRVTYEVGFLNEIVPSTDVAQFFKVWIVLVGEGGARLDQKQFIVVVPALECRP
jgi:hypothetical protein